MYLLLKSYKKVAILLGKKFYFWSLMSPPLGNSNYFNTIYLLFLTELFYIYFEVNLEIQEGPPLCGAEETHPAGWGADEFQWSLLFKTFW